MKRALTSFALLACLSTTALAQHDPLREIYPWKPTPLEELNQKVTRLTEEAHPVTNIYEMDRQGLLEKNTTIQPWAGPYWALNQGQIANNYQDKSYLKFWQMLGWKGNVKRWNKRREKKLPNVYNMDQEDIAKLAPSEKYDLLLGDTNFDLTHRVWNFVETWGNQKKWGFLSSINIPEGYRIPKANKLMALWEGICHGWAVAAGGSERPLKTVNIKLPNGKILPFYPDDIKALISLMYANSVVQDNVIVEGLRCDDKRPERDKFGRYIDELPKKEGEAILPRCADVHPAVWHSSVVNLTGIQGRSFIVEIDANATVNNHPLSGYKFKWFNPKSGKKGDLAESVIDLAGYDDPYKSSRSPHAVKLVGVDMEMRFIDWSMPNERSVDGPENDKVKDNNFMYDLELDAQGNIVGGQWRATKRARGNGIFAPKTDQPDFFWVLPRNHKMYFQNLELEAWDGRGQTPKSWQVASKSAHGFVYNVTREYGFDEKCTVLPKRGRQTKEVPCEFKYPRPQPLINVVNQLLEMSRQ